MLNLNRLWAALIASIRARNSGPWISRRRSTRSTQAWIISWQSVLSVAVCGKGSSTGRGSEIVLSRPVLEPLPQIATESTLCHEMIHAWVDLVQRRRESHGPLFRARMAAINAAQSRFQVSIRHSYPVPPRPPRWLAVCPRCGRRTPCRRRTRNAACRPCCMQHFQGRWDASCVLSYVEAEE